MFLLIQKEICTYKNIPSNVRKNKTLYLFKLYNIATKLATCEVLQSSSKSKNGGNIIWEDRTQERTHITQCGSIAFALCQHSAQLGKFVLTSHIIHKILLSPLATWTILLSLQWETLVLNLQRSSWFKVHQEATWKYIVLKHEKF